MKKKTLYAFVSILAIFSLLFSACGEEEFYEEETYAEEETITEEEPVTEEEAAQDLGVPENASTPGEVVYDFGFTPAENGFNFENYGDDIQVTNLTADELRRMFGDEVCADINGDECILTPPAEQWMEQINGDMAGGHCEGMAVLSLMMYTGQVSPSDFGGDLASELDINDEALQREIAYWWATQAVDPTASSVIRGTPMDILETVRQMDVNGETYTIGIYNEAGEGHAITPFGVEDKGDGLYAILVYDNNYPGETRELFIDSRDGSWTYETSINPQVETDVWSGNAETQTLDLTPTSARLDLQSCPFCESGQASVGKLAMTSVPVNQFFLDGEGHLLITDENGNRLGYVDGVIVNEIDGASYNKYRMLASGNTPEPIYSVPADLDVTITIDGTDLTEETLTDLVMIGPGYTIGVEYISLAPGQVDTAYFYPADQMIAYETESDESPSIIFGVENPDADYYFEVYGADMVGGGIITAWLDSAAGDLLINTEKLTGEGSFNFYLTRITDEAEEEFYAEDIVLNEGALVYVNYAEWTEANPDGIYFGVDLDGDGEIDEEYVVDDAE
jgi:hypothetical protein